MRITDAFVSTVTSTAKAALQRSPKLFRWLLHPRGNNSAAHPSRLTVPTAVFLTLAPRSYVWQYRGESSTGMPRPGRFGWQKRSGRIGIVKRKYDRLESTGLPQSIRDGLLRKTVSNSISETLTRSSPRRGVGRRITQLCITRITSALAALLPRAVLSFRELSRFKRDRLLQYLQLNNELHSAIKMNRGCSRVPVAQRPRPEARKYPQKFVPMHR